MSTSETKLEDIVSLAKRRGFIFQGSEVYGGLAGTWDYGPLGVALKRNITNLWWHTFVESRDDMYGVDAAILMNPKVWQASGHVDTFTDPLVECSECKGRFRADKLMTASDEFSNLVDLLSYEYIKKHQPDALNEPEVTELAERMHNIDISDDKQHIVEKLKKSEYWNNLTDSRSVILALKESKGYLGQLAKDYLIYSAKCPNCGKQSWGLPKTFNMMFKTNIGPLSLDPQISFPEDGLAKIVEHNYTYLVKWPEIKAVSRDDVATNTVYLRPETAQGIFTNYKNIIDTLYPDLPFGVAQIGKAFRNEISPRDFIFRSREFEQMEIEYFVHPEKWEESFEALRKDIHAFLDSLGLPKDNIHELEVPENDRAHYSKRTIDIEYDYPIGREELLGLAYRTDFDLGNIQRESGKGMEYTVKGTNERFVPHVIEPSFGVERMVMAVLSAAYKEDEVNGEKRIYLALPEHLAPVKYAVSPLLKNKPELVDKAREVYAALKKKYGAVMWDDNGNIGKRYRRQDEIGTPYCVVIDFETIEGDGTVTVRNRDTTEQSRVRIEDLV